MSDEAEGACWSSGLTRSYSEHAALVLRHLQQQRHEAAKCSRSRAEFHLGYDTSHSEADDEDDEPTNKGSSTWRISGSTSEEGPHQRCYKAVDIGGGDSVALTGEFSELSLRQQRPSQNCEGDVVVSSSSARQTTSSTERRCQMFDEYDDEDDHFTLVDSDESDEFRQSQEQNDRSARDRHNDGMAMAEGASVSMTSLGSLSHQRLSRKPLQRHISYEDWARDKQRELQRRRDEERRAEEQRREIEEREKREREEKERQDYENYVDWLERKKREQTLKRELAEKELDLRKRIQDVEDKAKLAKIIYLSQWRRKKKEQQKASEKEELMKQKKAEEEKQRRLQDSLKAYEKWREKAKNTPRPATQGLLPHQKAKPTFTNPTPWQPLINNASDDSDSASQTKISATPIKSQRSRRTLVKR